MVVRPSQKRLRRPARAWDRSPLPPLRLALRGHSLPSASPSRCCGGAGYLSPPLRCETLSTQAPPACARLNRPVVSLTLGQPGLAARAQPAFMCHVAPSGGEVRGVPRDYAQAPVRSADAQAPNVSVVLSFASRFARPS